MKTEKQQADNMITLICNAYTYLEFSKSFNKYYNILPSDEFDTPMEAFDHWNDNIVADYNTVSEYMKPAAIKQAHKLIMGEF